MTYFNPILNNVLKVTIFVKLPNPYCVTTFRPISLILPRRNQKRRRHKEQVTPKVFTSTLQERELEPDNTLNCENKDAFPIASGWGFGLYVRLLLVAFSASSTIMGQTNLAFDCLNQKFEVETDPFRSPSHSRYLAEGASAL